jgi:hypothetical protein
MIIPSFLRSTSTTAGTNNATVWRYWNKDYFNAASYLTTTHNSTTYADSTWKIWNSDYTEASSWIPDSTDSFFHVDPGTGSSATAIRVWQEWNVPQEARESTRRASAEQREAWRRMEQEQRQQEERQQEEETRARWKREAEERAKGKAAADKRAEELLRSCLTLQQQEELDRLNHFHLLVGDRRYRIKRGRTRNIELLDEAGRPIKKLCAHPGEYVPDADTMLAQKLMLETDEEAFLKLANHTPVHYPPEPQTARPSEQVARAV